MKSWFQAFAFGSNATRTAYGEEAGKQKVYFALQTAEVMAPSEVAEAAAAIKARTVRRTAAAQLLHPVDHMAPGFPTLGPEM